MTSDTKPDNRISEFIQKHHVLTLSTVQLNQPWCANCYYVYHREKASFIFTSDDDTRHAREMTDNNFVAGSVVLETNEIGKIQGIQFQGYVEKTDNKKHKQIYLKRFPFAALMKTNLWILEITYIKMTDNRLGFGKKLIWDKHKL
jgi:uncharacterized protein